LNTENLETPFESSTDHSQQLLEICPVVNTNLETSIHSMSLMSLSKDTLRHITKFLIPKDRATLSQVCKIFHLLWTEKFDTHFHVKSQLRTALNKYFSDSSDTLSKKAQLKYDLKKEFEFLFTPIKEKNYRKILSCTWRDAKKNCKKNTKNCFINSQTCMCLTKSP